MSRLLTNFDQLVQEKPQLIYMYILLWADFLVQETSPVLRDAALMKIGSIWKSSDNKCRACILEMFDILSKTSSNSKETEFNLNEMLFALRESMESSDFKQMETALKLRDLSICSRSMARKLELLYDYEMETKFKQGNSKIIDEPETIVQIYTELVENPVIDFTNLTRLLQKQSSYSIENLYKVALKARAFVKIKQGSSFKFNELEWTFPKLKSTHELEPIQAFDMKHLKCLDSLFFQKLKTLNSRVNCYKLYRKLVQLMNFGYFKSSLYLISYLLAIKVPFRVRCWLQFLEKLAKVELKFQNKSLEAINDYKDLIGQQVLDEFISTRIVYLEIYSLCCKKQLKSLDLIAFLRLEYSFTLNSFYYKYWKREFEQFKEILHTKLCEFKDWTFVTDSGLEQFHNFELTSIKIENSLVKFNSIYLPNKLLN